MPWASSVGIAGQTALSDVVGSRGALQTRRTRIPQDPARNAWTQAAARQASWNELFIEAAMVGRLR